MAMFSWDVFPLTALLAAGAGFLVGGVSKGAFGVGLPLLALPIMVNFMPVSQAMALLTVPSIVTNVWQALHGNHLREVLKRFWVLGVFMVIGIYFGTLIMVSMPDRFLYVVMGLAVMIQPVLRFLRPALSVPARVQKYGSPFIGLASGFVGGMSGLFGPPILTYLVMLRLEKNLFTVAVSFVFVLGSVSIAVFLSRLGVMGTQEYLMSSVALIPAFLGIFAGLQIRKRINQAQFEKSLTVLLLLTAIGLFAKAI